MSASLKFTPYFTEIAPTHVKALMNPPPKMLEPIVDASIELMRLRLAHVTSLTSVFGSKRGVVQSVLESLIDEHFGGDLPKRALDSLHKEVKPWLESDASDTAEDWQATVKSLDKKLVPQHESQSNKFVLSVLAIIADLPDSFAVPRAKTMSQKELAQAASASVAKALTKVLWSKCAVTLASADPKIILLATIALQTAVLQRLGDGDTPASVSAAVFAWKQVRDATEKTLSR